MTTPRRQLTEAQLREQIREGATRRGLRLQGFSFSNAEFSRAFAVVDDAGEQLRLSPERLTQIRAASRQSRVAREERARLVRAEAWALPSERSERRTVRREFNREAREIGREFTRARIEGRLDEASLLQLDVKNANRRALEVRGVPASLAARHGLLNEDWNSKGLQAVLRRLDNLLAKGLTVEQAFQILEGRAHRVADLFREERSANLMILAREFYTRQQREDRLRRRRQRRRQMAA